MVLEPTHPSSFIRSLEDRNLIHLARALDNEVSMVRFESIFCSSCTTSYQCMIPSKEALTLKYRWEKLSVCVGGGSALFAHPYTDTCEPHEQTRKIPIVPVGEVVDTVNGCTDPYHQPLPSLNLFLSSHIKLHIVAGVKFQVEKNATRAWNMIHYGRKW